MVTWSPFARCPAVSRHGLGGHIQSERQRSAFSCGPWSMAVGRHHVLAEPLAEGRGGGGPLRGSQRVSGADRLQGREHPRRRRRRAGCRPRGTPRAGPRPTPAPRRKSWPRPPLGPRVAAGRWGRDRPPRRWPGPRGWRPAGLCQTARPRPRCVRRSTVSATRSDRYWARAQRAPLDHSLMSVLMPTSRRRSARCWLASLGAAAVLGDADDAGRAPGRAWRPYGPLSASQTSSRSTAVLGRSTLEIGSSGRRGTSTIDSSGLNPRTWGTAVSNSSGGCRTRPIGANLLRLSRPRPSGGRVR